MNVVITSLLELAILLSEQSTKGMKMPPEITSIKESLYTLYPQETEKFKVQQIAKIKPGGKKTKVRT